MSRNNMKQTIEIEESFEKLNESIIDYAQKNDESQLITALKDLFAGWIDSKRRLRNIRNIQEFLIVLKQRSKYKPDEFDVFKQLSKKIITDSKFADLVENHCKLLKERSSETQPLPNLYGISCHCRCIIPQKIIRIFVLAAKRQRQGRDMREDPFPPIGILPRVNFSPPDEKRNKIFGIISKGLDYSEFQTLARNLEIIEPEIKEIVAKNRDYRSRTMVLLEIYERRHSSYKKLIYVLKHVMGRSDLVKSIENL